MFTSSKFAAVCLTVTALFNDVNAEAEVAQTFGLLGSGYRAPSHAGPYEAPSNAGPYGAPSGGVYGGVVASVRPTGRSAGHDGLGVEILGRGTGVGNAFGGTSSGGAFGLGGLAGGRVTNNVYGGVGGAVRPGAGATNGSGRPVSGAPSGTVGAGAIVNTGPYGGVGEITRPEAGKPANGGTSANVAGATDDKKNTNVYGGVSGATDTGAVVTKGAEKPVSDGKDVPAVVAGDKNAVPVVAAGGAAVPEAGKSANGGASGNVAGATDDKKNTNVYGGVSGATDTGAVVTKGAEKPVSDGKDVPAVVAGDKNAVPVVAAGVAAVPGAGKSANGGTSGNVAGATDDKKNTNVYGGVNGATDTSAAVTKGAEKPVSDGKDVPAVVAGDKNAVPVVAAGGAAVPEAGKPANGGTSGNVAGATDDKKNTNVYGGVNGATDTGAAVTKGAEKPVSDGKDVPAVVAGDKNAVPVVAAGGAAVPEAGNPANGGTSGNVAGATDDKKNTNVYGGVNGATDTGAVVTKGAEKPVSDGKDVPAAVAGDKNAVPVVAAGGAAVPEAGNPANGGASGNVAGATDDKKNTNVYGGVNGATDTGAVVTKGAEKPVSDGKDVPAVVAGDKNAVPVVAAGGAAVPEAGKPANGGTSGNVAGATDDKKSTNVYGGVNGATDTGAVVTIGAGMSTTDGKDRGIVAGADGKPCTDGAGGAIGSAVKPTPMVNGNTISAKPLKSGAKVVLKPTTASPYNGRVGGVTQRAYRKLRSL
uniref:Uncharacterized protein n=1 Tax=Peronospora matthiolae TaxID=2874970 RepID=A0AAV1TQ72_9STRA